MDLQYESNRKRSEFGVHANFSDTDPVTIDFESEIVPYNNYREVKTKTQTFECIPQYACHAVNTEPFCQKDVSINHTEGGWPENVSNAQDKLRYIRKIEGDVQYNQVCMELTQRLMKTIESNLTIDLYKDYFEECQENFSVDPPDAKTIFVVRDPAGENRTVCQIAWHPDNSNKFAATYASTDFEANMSNQLPLPAYIWDINNSNEYDLELIPDSPLMSIAFSYKRSDELVGGCFNGVVAFWDTRAGSRPTQKSSIQNSHQDPVNDIAFIQSRSGCEFCSVSTDGVVMWWDGRRLSEPIDTFVLEDPETGIRHGGTCLEYRLDAGANKYLIGTETGLIFNIERKAKKDQESQKTIKSIYGKKSQHFGPIYSIKRNYAAVKGFLTAGDWGCRMWTEETKTTNFGTDYQRTYVNYASWSPTRFGSFFVGKADGYLDIWDYVYTQDAPVWSSKISEQALNTISVDKSGRKVAIGDVSGTISVMELTNSLVYPTSTEKNEVQQIFDREGIREKTLNQSLKSKQAAIAHTEKRKLAQEKATKELKLNNDKIAKNFEEIKNDIELKWNKMREGFDIEPLPERFLTNES